MSSKDNFRRLIEIHHEFLWNLYNGKPHTVKRLLTKATNAQLCTLIKIIYALEEGLIPMKIRHYKNLLRSKRIKPILLLKYNVKQLLRSTLDEKKKWVYQYCSLYKSLLYPLFEQE